MTSRELLNLEIEKNNGVLLATDATKYGISREYFSRYIKANNLKKLAQGVYSVKQRKVDLLYVIAYKNKDIIYSLDTALYLLGLIDKFNKKISATVKSGTNATHLKKYNTNIHYISNEFLNLGKINCTTEFGNDVSTYNMERTICDVIRYKDDFDSKTFKSILKKYFSSAEKNVSLLFEYAKSLKVFDKVKMYTEVLM